MKHKYPCIRCNGTGRIADMTCSRCCGTGKQNSVRQHSQYDPAHNSDNKAGRFGCEEDTIDRRFSDDR